MTEYWIEWINANKGNDTSWHIWKLDLWYSTALEDVEEKIIEHYIDCNRKARLEFNRYSLEDAVTNYLREHYEDIINPPFHGLDRWDKINGRYIQSMQDMLSLQRFNISQYSEWELLNHFDSPYWDTLGQFALLILSPAFIQDLVDRLEPRLSDERGLVVKIDNFTWVRTSGLEESSLYICQEDLEALDWFYNAEPDPAREKAITKLQAITRGRNTRWRVPLHLFTIS